MEAVDVNKKSRGERTWFWWILSSFTWFSPSSFPVHLYGRFFYHIESYRVSSVPFWWLLLIRFTGSARSALSRSRSMKAFHVRKEARRRTTSSSSLTVVLERLKNARSFVTTGSPSFFFTFSCFYYRVLPGFYLIVRETIELSRFESSAVEPPGKSFLFYFTKNLFH